MASKTLRKTTKQPVRVLAPDMTKTRRSAVVSFMQPRRIMSLSEANKLAPDIISELNRQGVTNPSTGKAYTQKTVKQDLAETIGQWTYVKPQWNARVLLNVDTTWKDYVFWDALRRGTAPGYEISGPSFCQPAAQTTASYCFGKGISASLVESAVTAQERKALNEAAVLSLVEANGKPTQNKINGATTGGKPAAQLLPKPKPAPNANDQVAWTNLQIKNMLERNQSFLLNTVVDEYCLGNQFVFINPDCTFSIASPETVTVEYSASDYRRVLRVIVKNKMQGAWTEDVFTDKERTITTHYFDGREQKQEVYENLIGRIPMVHFANDRSANEIYGRPIYEAGLPIMWRYDNLINNILEGVTLLGTPIPMFVGLDNPSETKILNSDQIPYVDEFGQQQVQYVTRLDRQTGLYIGKGGDGKMLSTNVGFTKDSLDALRQLFLLWLNQTHIPELIWGGAIASSKASAETQMPPFIQYINFRRLMLEGQGSDPALNLEARGGLLELIDIWLRTYKLLNPSIVVGPVQIDWPEIDLFGDQWKYMWGSFLGGLGKITDESLLKMSGFFSDPAGEVMKASGKKPRPPQFDQYDQKLRAARLAAAQAQGEPADDDGPPWSTDWVTPIMDYDESNEYGVNQVAAHQHADGAAVGYNDWNVNGPLFWIGMYGNNN